MLLDRRQFTLTLVFFICLLPMSQIFAQYGFGDSGRVIHAGGEARIASSIVELSDGSVLLGWSRYDSTFVRRGYAQIIEEDGSTRFLDSPLSITPYTAIIRDLHLLADAEGGFTLAYGTRESLEAGETFTQRFDSDGVSSWTDAVRFGISTPNHEIDATRRSLLVHGSNNNVFLYNTRRISESRYDARIYAVSADGEIPEGFSVSGKMLQGNVRILSSAAQLSDGGLIFASKSQNVLIPEILVNKTDINGDVVFLSSVELEVLSGFYQPILSSNNSGDIYLMAKNISNNYSYRLIRLNEDVETVWDDANINIYNLAIGASFEPVLLTTADGDLHLIAEANDNSLRYWHIENSDTPVLLTSDEGEVIIDEMPVNTRFDLTRTDDGMMIVAWAGMPSASEIATFGLATIDSENNIGFIELDQGDNTGATDIRLYPYGDTGVDVFVAASNEMLFYRFAELGETADLQLILDEYVSYPLSSAAVNTEDGIYSVVAAQEGLRPYMITANGVTPSFEENPRGVVTHQLSHPIDFSGMVNQDGDFISAFSQNNETYIFKTDENFEPVWEQGYAYPFTAYHMWGHDQGVNFYTIIGNNICLAGVDVGTFELNTEQLYVPTGVRGNPVFIDGDPGYGWCVIGASPLSYIHKTASSNPLLPWNDGMPVWVGDTFEFYLCGESLAGMDVALAWLDGNAEAPGIYMMRYDTDMNPLFGSERALVHQFDLGNNPSDCIADICDADGNNMWMAYSIEEEMFYMSKINGSGVVIDEPIILSEELDIDKVILRSDEVGGAWIAFHSPTDDLTMIYHIDVDGQPASEWWEDGPVPMISSRDIGEIRAENLDERGGWLIVAEINAGSALEGLPNPVGVQRLIDDVDDIDEDIKRQLPENFNINRTWPNPFNGSLNISFTLPATMPVKMNVYDISGRLTDVISSAVYTAGEHKLSWNSNLNNIASGTYFVKLSTPVGTKIQKVVLVK